MAGRSVHLGGYRGSKTETSSFGKVLPFHRVRMHEFLGGVRPGRVYGHVVLDK